MRRWRWSGSTRGSEIARLVRHLAQRYLDPFRLRQPAPRVGDSFLRRRRDIQQSLATVAALAICPAVDCRHKPPMQNLYVR